MADDPLPSLRAALEVSPDNVPLRVHVARLLLKRGDAADAELEFRRALRREPQSFEIKFGLVAAYRAQAKYSEAHVVLDSLVQADIEVGPAYLERARTSLAEGDLAAAVRDYRSAEREGEEDTELAEQLGIEEVDESDAWSEIEDHRLRAGHGEGPEGPVLRPVRVETTFADVGGMAELKRDIQKKILFPLQHPELYGAYGKKAGGGILLYGPPGCGKTHIARATAGELSAHFLSVGIHDVVEMWIGQSERNLHDVFELARANTPCVLFFDEVDALGAKRADFRGTAGRQTVNQFLAELDGIENKANEGVLILAATNAPWHLDPAFRRPGRFDRVVFVPPPDLAGRVDILRLLLAGKPQEELDLGAVAKRLEGFSGADLREVVDTAIEAKLEEAMTTGLPEPLTTKGLLQAAKSRKPTTREWFRAARNYVLYANEGGEYDDLLPYVDR
ncbi:MAG: AAA family ATPase [Planctomycetota bacterium]